MGRDSGVQGWPLRSGRRRVVEVPPSGWTPPPRGKGSTDPGGISLVWNVATPLRSGRKNPPGRPTVRKAQLRSGNRMAQEANAGSRKAAGNQEARLVLHQSFLDNWPDTGSARTRKGADVGQVSLRRHGLTDDTGTEGHVGRHDDAVTGRDAGRGGHCRHGERTGGHHRRLVVDQLAGSRRGRTASAAENLRGNTGRGPEKGPEPAEVDAPFPGERVVQRPSGHGNQRWAWHGGCRRSGGVTTRFKGRTGGLGAAPPSRMDRSPRQACVHPKGQRQTAPARHSRCCGPRPPGACPRRVGTRMGGTDRAEVVRLPPGPWLS